MIAQAFILAAGLGKRLRPLTDDLPKPLIPIFQKPLITFALDHLIDAGVKSFLINTHHRAETLENLFVSRSYRDIPVQLIHEPEILETGGGIKNAEALLGTEPFLTYSGDLLTDSDLQPLLEEHLRSGNDVTLGLRRDGLRADMALEGGRVVDIAGRYGRPGEFDYAGIAVWNAAIFQRIPPEQHVSFIPILAEWIGQGGQIGGVVFGRSRWFNIGSRKEYLDVHRTIQEEHWKPVYVKSPDWPTPVAPDARIDPSARFLGYCSIGAGCEVGADAILENTVLWPGAQIASRSRLRNCIVRSHRQAAGELSDLDI